MLDRTDLRRWKHTLDYYRDKYGKDTMVEWHNQLPYKIKEKMYV